LSVLSAGSAKRIRTQCLLDRTRQDRERGRLVDLADTMSGMESSREVEFVFEPQDEGGYHAYAPELPGLHTDGDSLEEATTNAKEALALYVEGLREDGESLEMGVVRLKLPMPA